MKQNLNHQQLNNQFFWLAEADKSIDPLQAAQSVIPSINPDDYQETRPFGSDYRIWNFEKTGGDGGGGIVFSRSEDNLSVLKIFSDPESFRVNTNLVDYPAPLRRKLSPQPAPETWQANLRTLQQFWTTQIKQSNLSQWVETRFFNQLEPEPFKILEFLLKNNRFGELSLFLKIQTRDDRLKIIPFNYFVLDGTFLPVKLKPCVMQLSLF